MDEERWMPVSGYEDFYQVSDQGRIRSLGREGVYREASVGALKTKNEG